MSWAMNNAKMNKTMYTRSNINNQNTMIMFSFFNPKLIHTARVQNMNGKKNMFIGEKKYSGAVNPIRKNAIIAPNRSIPEVIRITFCHEDISSFHSNLLYNFIIKYQLSLILLNFPSFFLKLIPAMMNSKKLKLSEYGRYTING